MDSRQYMDLMEAYVEVYASQEEINEADSLAAMQARREKRLKAQRKREGTTSTGRDFGHDYSLTPAQQKARRDAEFKAGTKKEEFDLFDEILEFLYVEGYVDTLEEAEWMMANIIDEEAIDIILGEAITSEKGKAKAAEMIAKRSTPSGRAKAGQGASVAQIKHISRANVDGYDGTPPNLKVAKNPVKSNFTGLNTGTGNKAARRAAALKKEEFVNEADSLAAMQARREKRLAAQRKREGTTATGRDFGHNYSLTPAQQKARRDAEFKAGTKNEEFEAWLDEAMTNYEKNRKRAAQRAAARNAARDQGKTGVVPGVGYVTPRRERETWTDKSGKTRHAKGL